MTTVTENGVSPHDLSGGAGVAAMSKMTAADKAFVHNKLVRFLDESDYEHMTVKEIAEAVGISRQAVTNELQKRNGGPLPRGRKQVHARRSGRQQNAPGQAQAILLRWLEENPGTWTMGQMEHGTRLPKSTLRTVVQALGIVPQKSPRGIAAALARREMLSAVEPEVLPEGDIDYLSTAQDGTLIGIDRGTGKLWVLTPSHLL